MFKDRFLIMTIDTSCKTTACGLVLDGVTIADFSVCDNKTHSVKLMPLIDKALNYCGAIIENVDLIAVTNGPGSYTGLRIGVVTAKTFAYINHIPVIGVNTLDALAHGFICGEQVLTVPVIDARNTRVYTTCYLGSEQIFDYNALTITELCSFVTNDNKINKDSTSVILCGDGLTEANKMIIDQLLPGYNLFYKDIIAPTPASIAAIAMNEYTKSGSDSSMYTGEKLGVNYMKKYNAVI